MRRRVAPWSWLSCANASAAPAPGRRQALAVRQASFEDFRMWLIGLGRDAFERVVQEPDRLAELPEVQRLSGRDSGDWSEQEWPAWEMLTPPRWPVACRGSPRCFRCRLIVLGPEQPDGRTGPLRAERHSVGRDDRLGPGCVAELPAPGASSDFPAGASCRADPVSPGPSGTAPSRRPTHARPGLCQPARPRDGDRVERVRRVAAVGLGPCDRRNPWRRPGRTAGSME
ncbi:DUF4240 domain-containing protein [Micromonospora sp. NBC_00898]|uniref:DUF4240 domain-containing protein n=1 Tax=Micromonospora sp. NBC_00898 TaxID=2975981 RepID=UPI003864B6CA|nr:DUF4240 domain-containing protein [Micromonospora sp. NBC_00898]